MQDNIPDALISAFERQYDTTWNDPALRNERLAMRYGWAAAMEAKQCLHQILEPAPAADGRCNFCSKPLSPQMRYCDSRCMHAFKSKEDAQAAPAAVAVPVDVPAEGAVALRGYLQVCEQHAITPDVGGAFAHAFASGFNLSTVQPAPAVAVPDEREAFEAWAREYGTWDVERDDVQSIGIASYTDVAVVVAWHAWQARAALAATPATVKQNLIVATPAADAPMVDMTPPATRRDRWMYEQGRLAERDARTHGSVAAAAPVLPAPVATITNIDEFGPCFGWLEHWANFPVGTKFYTEPQLRALLATGGQAQAEQLRFNLTVNQMRQAIEFATGGFTPDTEDELETSLTFRIGPLQDDDGKVVADGMHCWLTDLAEEGAIPLDEYPTESDLAKAQAPQAQDADDAALIEWLSGQYLAADFHWGEPKTPVLVIEIPATASVCGDFRTDVRAAIAIAAAKGEQQS